MNQELQEKLDRLATPVYVEAESNEIDSAGIREINQLLEQAGLVPGAGWVWGWTAVHQMRGVAYAGNLTTRLSKLYKIRKKEKMPADLLETIGNIAGRHKVKANQMFVQVVWEIGWRAGEFGDEGSCLFSYGGISLAAAERMKQLGSGAVCIYHAITKSDPPQCGRGRARAWLIPDRPEDDLLLTTNAYGLPHNTLALALAQALGTDYLPVRTSGERTSNVPGFWINGDGAIYGPPERLAHYTAAENVLAFVKHRMQR